MPAKKLYFVEIRRLLFWQPRPAEVNKISFAAVCLACDLGALPVPGRGSVASRLKTLRREHG